ncbi:glycoside hydrolase family 36 protein [Vibrio sp. WXL210]|uniref:glycoside hydrolase family 36 protein n=1 Tax=Vibrio sp. WXL210 TaxID=3450709 RepID=UPI003EC8CD43
MTNKILFSCQREALVYNLDVEATLNGDNLSFTHIGLHNSPVDERYALCHFELVAAHDSRFVGEGFQMLSQSTGTLGDAIELGRCPDNNADYRIYPIDAPKRHYNTLVIELEQSYVLFGFTSCRRFAGYFEIEHGPHGSLVTAYIDGENTHPQDWPDNQLESLTLLEASDLEQLYQSYSELIARSHPPRAKVAQPSPVGWCSWYAYYADVSERHIDENLALMTGQLDALEWVLLDDGYQAFMGDWLDPSDKFESGVPALVERIKHQGKRAGIWLAPFIAQPQSRVFRHHPDWFVQDEHGQPLKAETVTYGGWRCTPWYVLDTSKPEVLEHLTYVVSVMRQEWGVELFKLDANYWGTLKGTRLGRGVTGVEAYRMGMQAIAQGVGDGWILGCNAPMWPSLGLVDAMRVSDDVEREPYRFGQIAKQAFFRSWQHQRLWHLDPDCVTLTSLPNQGTERRYYDFHRTAILASSGWLLSGDPLQEMTLFVHNSWRKLLLRAAKTQQAARFDSLAMNHARLSLTNNNELHCLFNFNSQPTTFTLTSSRPVLWFDYWTGARLSHEKTQMFEIELINHLSARAIITGDVGDKLPPRKMDTEVKIR